MDEGRISDCIWGAQNRERIKTLEKSQEETRISLEKSNAEIWKVITEIRDKLIGRPSWAVCIIITMLSSITVASITFAVTMAKMIILR